MVDFPYVNLPTKEVAMDAANIIKPEEKKPLSLQAEIIRQIQVNDGLTPCYATPASNECENKECGWRYDCFDETSECENDHT